MTFTQTLIKRNESCAARAHAARPPLPTGCGMERLAEEELAAAVSSASGVHRQTIARLAIDDHGESLKADRLRLQASSHLPRGLPVSGVRYDEASGRAAVLFEATT